MKLEKVKLKIAEGYCDEAIANMSGMAVEDIAALRAPAPKAAPVQKAPTKKVVTPTQVKAEAATKKAEVKKGA